MKKDIEIPIVKDIYVAIVFETNPIYKTDDWNAYIINDSNSPAETVLIVSKGSNSVKETPIFRHQIKLLPAKSYAKIELIHEAVLQLKNEFKVSFFQNKVLFYKNYIFKPNAVSIKNLTLLPIIPFKGVMAE